MKLKDGMNILELGCGGGIFCHRIKTFLPNARVTGLDRDEGHIEFARAKSESLKIDCNFVIGDALNLPFADNSFDACTSFTVAEHVETDRFIGEQYRILKLGGVLSVLQVKSSFNVSSNECIPTSPEETALLNKAWKKAGDFDKENGIGTFTMNASDIPIAMEETGFKNVNVDFISILQYAPDSADTSKELALHQININRIHALSSMAKALNIDPDCLTEPETQRLTDLINERFDKRIDKYLNGEKLWDMSTCTVMAVIGYK